MRIPVRKIAYKFSKLFRQYYYLLFPDRSVIREWEQKPRALMIEPINVCNANCVFCAYQYLRRPKQAMSDELFEKALGDYAGMGGGDLALTTLVGDPLLDVSFVRRIRRARASKAIQRIGTITNCLDLHKVGAKELLTSGLTSLTVSTTGFDADMYQRVYRSSRYEDMRRNVVDLVRTNHALGKPVRIVIALRIDRPVEEVLALRDFQEVQQLADAVDFNPYFDSWSGRIKPEDLTGQMRLRSASLFLMKKRVPCGLLWSGTGVLVDGTVTACCCRDLDGDSDLVLGNIGKTSLREMWQSQRMKDLRQEWQNTGRLPNICRDCTHYHPYTHHMLKEFRNAFM